MDEDKTKKYAGAKKVIFITLGLNTVIFMAKVFASLNSGSQTIMAECIHTLADMAMTLAVLTGISLSFCGNEKWKDAENFITRLIAAVLSLTAAGIGINGIASLLNGDVSAPGASAIMAILLSVIIKETMYRYTYKMALKTESTALIADAWHHRSDALSSLASLTGVIGAKAGIIILDPIAAIAVCFMIIKAAKCIYYSADKCEEKENPEALPQTP